MAQKNKNASSAKISAEQKYNDFVADLFIRSIESGTAPWTKPWSTEDMMNMAPRNPETGTLYKGSNAAMLMMTEALNGYEDPRWMTFNQAKNAGGYVRAGEHGVPLRTFIFEKEVPVLDENGKPVLDKDGKPVTEIEEVDPPIINTFTVFNVKQIVFPPEHKYSQPMPKEVTKEQVWENLQKAEDLINSTNAQIVFGGTRAFYAPGKDYINLPKKERFKTQEGYYSTALHELSHWTGHRGRLDRPYNGRFGTPNYAREELVAEISSFMLCMNLGIGHNLENHASYVESWSKILKDDKKEIIEATRKANEAQKFITQFSQKNVIDEEKIYLISEKDEKKLDEELLELGAFYDINENKFYIMKSTHDVSKFADYFEKQQEQVQIQKSELELQFEKGQNEKGYYSKIDFETFKKINNALPMADVEGEMFKNWFAWDKSDLDLKGGVSGGRVDDRGWCRSDVINGIASNPQALNYVLRQQKVPPMVYLSIAHGEGSEKITETFKKTGNFMLLNDANELLHEENKKAKANDQYFECDLSIVSFNRKTKTIGDNLDFKLFQNELSAMIRYIGTRGGDAGDLFKHLEDGSGIKIFWDPAKLFQHDDTQKLLDSCYCDALKEENKKFKKFLRDNDNAYNVKNSMSKIENLQNALNKAIKFLNEQSVKESLTPEEKKVYVGQLSDLIAHAETLKQLVELDSEIDVKGIKSDAINSLSKSQDSENLHGIDIPPKKANPAYADTYLVVPFYDKNEAKQLGAKWDRQIKHWYVPAGTDLNLFDKWKRADVAVNKYQREAELMEENSGAYLNKSKNMKFKTEQKTVNKSSKKR